MSEADELRGEVSAMESIMRSKDTQLGNQKKETDARIAALEKQLQEARSQQVSHGSKVIVMGSKDNQLANQKKEIDTHIAALKNQLQKDRSCR